MIEMSVSEAATDLESVIDTICVTHRIAWLTRAGKPVAALIDAGDYRQLLASREELRTRQGQTGRDRDSPSGMSE
ncbi:type II toxin-antitoxin system Phd/YefM family antitoxin [Sinomonas atrocyanea]